ncbi:MAG: N-acetylneuraminate synthase family protein [Candidatus Neomarinimicrobiota bacterium]
MNLIKNIKSNDSVYIIAEIGLNHNGDIDIAKKLIDVAAEAGCDAVKFQKRTPDLCVPEDQKQIERDTPWGRMTYIDYRHKIEFEDKEYSIINEYCIKKNIEWFVSTWDHNSVDVMEKIGVCAYKVPSACLTDLDMLTKLSNTQKPVIISTGMSTLEQIDRAVQYFDKNLLSILHCTSAYPCSNNEINLNMIHKLKSLYPENVIGYSGHETGLQISLAAVAMGSKIIERHITLDRTMWGSDQSASIEPRGLETLVRDIRVIEQAMGDGEKIIYDSELSSLEKLRRFK